MKRFSIVTVALNAAEHVRLSGLSLKAQTCTDYEWLVIDGASTDQTVESARSLDIPNTRIYSEKDRGIYDAMNKGIALAQGEWIYFLNGGDTLHSPTVLEDIAAFATRKPAVKLVYGNIQHIEGDRRLLESTTYVKRSLLLFEELNHQAVFAHRKLFEQVGNFDLQYPICADFDWLVRVFRTDAKVAHINITVANFLDGGVHTQNIPRLSAERRHLRARYAGPVKRRIGNFAARVRRRVRLMSGWMGEVK